MLPGEIQSRMLLGFNDPARLLRPIAVMMLAASVAAGAAILAPHEFTKYDYQFWAISALLALSGIGAWLWSRDGHPVARIAIHAIAFYLSGLLLWMTWLTMPDLGGIDAIFLLLPLFFSASLGQLRWTAALMLVQSAGYAFVLTTSSSTVDFDKFGQWQVITVGLLVGLIYTGMASRKVDEAHQELQTKVAELEYANRTLDTFSHTLVHDLRNPLLTIAGFAQLLGDTVGIDAARTQLLTENIEQSVARMNALIDDVLALATISRAVDRTECDPAGVVQEAAESVSGVDLKVGWMPDTISANKASLYRCFQNLLQNASSYAAGNDGRAMVEVSAEDTAHAWRFLVRDFGSGVEEDAVSTIFEAFQRGEHAPPTQGTGLGLSIVAACATAHGGSIDVHNADDGGAIFVLAIGKPDAGSSA